MSRRRWNDRRPHLPIYVFAVFDGERDKPIGTDTAVEHATGPDLILLKVVQLFAIYGYSTKRRRASLTRSRVGS